MHRSESMDVYRLQEYQQTSPAGFTKRVFQQSPNGLVFVLNFDRGQALPAHTHGESEITVTVLEGEAEADADGRVQPLERGGVVHCRGNETFSVRNVGTGPLSVLVFLYPGNPKFAGNVR